MTTTPRLLLVDDDDVFVRGLSREMSLLGWQTQTAPNAESALSILRQNEFDALLVDFRMPGADGVHVLSEVSRMQRRPVAVLLSGYLTVETTVRAIQDGANDVLEKPIAASDLDVRLRALLAARRSPSLEGASADVSGGLSKVLGETPSIRAVREQMQTAARYPELCLTIVGESGTGKEQIAEIIHSLAAPVGRYLPVKLTAIPDHLIEVELFGSEAQGSLERRPGLLELAGPGTLFFNELGELPPHLHRKLLHAIETRTFRRVGGEQDLPLKARLIAGTRRRTPAPEFAELYERIGSFTIHLPALRDRLTDIELIAAHVLQDVAQRRKRATPHTISAGGLEVLLRHGWPGNVRELELVLAGAADSANHSSLSAEELSDAIATHGMPTDTGVANDGASGTFPTSQPQSEPLRTLERRMITDAWRTSGRNLSAAARSLGLPRTTLRDRLKKYGLR